LRASAGGGQPVWLISEPGCGPCETCDRHRPSSPAAPTADFRSAARAQKHPGIGRLSCGPTNLASPSSAGKRSDYTPPALTLSRSTREAPLSLEISSHHSKVLARRPATVRGHLKPQDRRTSSAKDAPRAPTATSRSAGPQLTDVGKTKNPKLQPTLANRSSRSRPSFTE
jgi:hypothetical protein